MVQRNKFWLTLGIALSLLLSFSGAKAATLPFPFEDLNDNGVYDRGERNITRELKSGAFQTEHSIVIPARAGGFSCSKGFTLGAGRNITVENRYLYATGKDSSVSLNAGGRINVGTGVILKAVANVALYAQGDIYLGPFSSFQATNWLVNISSLSGSIYIADDAILAAKKQVVLIAADEISTDPGVTLLSSAGFIYIIGLGKTGTITMNGDRFEAAYGLFVYTEGSYVTFTDNLVRFPRPIGWAYLKVLGEDSVLDITGTQFKNLYSAEPIIDADTVIR